MGILARIFRFLFWTLVLSWAVLLLKRLAGAQTKEGNSGEGQQQNPSKSSSRLVRDPLCGMHVAEQLAVRIRMGNEMIHFCSPECRDQYQRETQKLAANG
jgi:YHS domain-containing protein